MFKLFFWSVFWVKGKMLKSLCSSLFLGLSWSLRLFLHLNFLGLALFSGVNLWCWGWGKLGVVQRGPPRFNTSLDSFLEDILDNNTFIVLCVSAGIPTAIVGFSNFSELLISDSIVTCKVRFCLDEVDEWSLFVQALCSHLSHLLRNFLKLLRLVSR